MNNIVAVFISHRGTKSRRKIPPTCFTLLCGSVPLREEIITAFMRQCRFFRKCFHLFFTCFSPTLTIISEENAMDTFLQKYQPQIKGSLSGWDRIVFRGCIRPLAYAFPKAK